VREATEWRSRQRRRKEGRKRQNRTQQREREERTEIKAFNQKKSLENAQLYEALITKYYVR